MTSNASAEIDPTMVSVDTLVARVVDSRPVETARRHRKRELRIARDDPKVSTDTMV
jgi:hypothetical protein